VLTIEEERSIEMPPLCLVFDLGSRSEERSLEMVRILLRHGADCSQTDGVGFRPLN